MSFLTTIGAVILASIAAVPGIEHVLIIGVDCMSPRGMKKTDTPTLDRLMQEGAFTLKARGVLPTKSSPNWASMLMGAGPEQHGITSNAWVPVLHAIAPTLRGPGGIFPTIVSLVREQRPESKIAVIHDWPGFSLLFERQMTDLAISPGDEQETTNKAIAYLKEEKPTLLVVHLDAVDHAMHESGFLSPQYLAAISQADVLIARMLDALKESGILDKTLVHIVADHGGRGKDHGGETMQELEIPWIMAGPGIKHGYQIASPVSICDSAPTIAYVLGLQTPEAWTGRPVVSIFE